MTLKQLSKTIATKPPKKGKRIVGSINPLLLEPQPATSSPMPDGIHGPASLGSAPTGDCGGCGMLAEDIEKESSIDYPKSNGLCPDIWDRVEVADSENDFEFKIHDDIRQKALQLVDVLLSRYHVKADGVYVVGSICSNQYTEDADVDVHIQVSLPDEVAEKLNGIRKLETERLFAGQDLLVGTPSKTHPLEFYFQSNRYGDLGSCGCYDLMDDSWVVQPQIVDLEFDPYEEYSTAFDSAIDFGKKAQDALFDLHADLFVLNSILDHASYEDVNRDDQMMSVIGRRLEETKDKLLDDVKKVAELKEEMVQVRRSSGVNPRNEEQAEAMRTDKDWLTANSTFKFLQRLGVLDQCWKVAEIWNAHELGQIDDDQVVFDLNC